MQYLPKAILYILICLKVSILKKNIIVGHESLFHLEIRILQSL